MVRLTGREQHGAVPCDHTFHAVDLGWTFTCPGKWKRNPAAAPWGLQKTLDLRARWPLLPFSAFQGGSLCWSKALRTSQLSKSRPYWWDPAVQSLQFRPSSPDLTAVFKAAAPGALKRTWLHLEPGLVSGLMGIQHRCFHLRTLSETGHRRNLAALRAKLSLCRGWSPSLPMLLWSSSCWPGHMALPPGDWHCPDSHRIQGGTGVEALQDGGPSLHWWQG